MKCAWQAYLQILPLWMRKKVDNLGRDSLQELRLRVDRPPELVLGGCNQYLERNVDPDDLRYCMNAASQYSPWASASVSKGLVFVAMQQLLEIKSAQFLRYRLCASVLREISLG